MDDPVEERNVYVYDITGNGTASANTDNVATSGLSRSQQSSERQRSRRQENDSTNSREDPHNLCFFIGDAAGVRISSFCCLCGVLATAVGACLILIFLISEYSPPLKDILNSQGLIISGLILLFFGIFSVVIGIYFCWVYKRRSRERRHVNRNDEIEAGFHQTERGSRGYDNNVVTSDELPSYYDLTNGTDRPVCLPVTRQESYKPPPSYVDAVKLYEKIKEDKLESEAVEEETIDVDPPPYAND